MSLGKRIQESREKEGWSREKLGEHMDPPRSQQGIGDWERDKYKPRLVDVMLIARLLQVDLTWLITGTYPATSSDNGQAGFRGRVVPSVDWSNIDKFVSAQYIPDMSARSYFPCGPRSFHTLFSDRSMEPEISPGEGLVVDPDLTPEPGDLIMVRLGNEVLVRIYSPREHDILLAPANKHWPERTIPKLTSDVLIGVVSEQGRRRR